MKYDFDFIRDRIDKSGVEAPPDMGESFVLDTLEGVEPKAVELKHKPKKWRIVASAAAVFVFVAVLSVALFMFFSGRDTDIVKGNTVTLPGGLSLTQFNSYDEVKASVNSVRIEQDKAVYYDSIADFLAGGYKGDDEEVALDGGSSQSNYAAESDTAYSSGSATGSSGSSRSDSYSETYKQVDGVDEADIIKTDGRYIYCVDGKEVVIFSAEGEDSRKVAAVDAHSHKAATVDEAEPDDDFDYEKYYYDDYYYMISDIYVKDDRLIVLYQSTDYGDDNYSSDTVAQVYDVSDIDNIALLDSISQTGYYISSRMIGDVLYTVSSYYPYGENYIPRCGNASSPDEIPADCIYAVEKPSRECFLVVSAYDTVDYSAQTQSKAIFGSAEDIYCNLDNLYIYSTDYHYGSIGDSDFYSTNVTSQILKVNLTDGLSFTAYTEIDGYIDDQYALDEYGGNLRAATTSYTDDGKDVNNLFVLDESLNVIGSVTGFAENESIKAVRYIGDTAYVITYERTDPLFIIDLSESSSPRILGEVEISGFSTMLVPVDEDTILGLGYYTQEEDYTDMEVQEGFKLALFDVSDKSNPTVLDSMSFINYDSPVQYNPRALVYNPERGDYVIPLNYHYFSYGEYDNWYSEYSGGMLNFSVEDGQIKVISQYKGDYEFDVNRCVYVGDYIYMSYYDYGSYDFGIRLDCVKYQ